MTFQILISTMNQTDKTLLDTMRLHSDAVVINQCQQDGKEEFAYKNHTVVWIDTKERGLSRSRNKALQNATADICLFADDDEIFSENTEPVIRNAFFTHRHADIIRFKVQGIEKEFKKYGEKEFSVTKIKSLKTSSVEIAFLRKKIAGKVQFDERLGAGTRFFMGEENVFLINCLRNGNKMVYVPQTIAKLHIGNSTWFQGYTPDYFISRGASFRAMDTVWTPLLILQYAVRKRKLFRQTISVKDAVRYMKEGAKQIGNEP